MTSRTELIILHATEFGEDSLILHAIGSDGGRRGYVMRRPGRKASTTLLAPMGILEAELIERPGGKLPIVRSLAAKHPLTSLRTDLYKSTECMFISEVLYRLVVEDAAERGLFGFLERQMLLLDALEDSFSNFHIHFLLSLASVMGFSPVLGDGPGSIENFTGRRTPLLLEFMRKDFAEAMLIPMRGDERSELAEGILRYICWHTGCSPVFNSLRILREIFA